MKTVVYLISLPFIYAVSLLPFPLLYLLSDGLYLLVFRVLGYRRSVAEDNLRRSFPDKSDEERQLILRRFYRYFCDLALETLKTLTISPKSLQKRVVFRDVEVIDRHFQQQQSIILVMGHFGNWELAGAAFALQGKHPLYVIYHPLSNPHFERLFYRMRTRLGNRLYAMRQAIRCIMRDRDLLTATAFIADQSPTGSAAYWTRFLNQDTAVFTGTEKIARKMGYPVIYISVRRVKRGLYEVTAEELAAAGADLAENAILERQTRRLEQDILSLPETWLWTHRRWKRQRDDDKKD